VEKLFEFQEIMGVTVFQGNNKEIIRQVTDEIFKCELVWGKLKTASFLT
jgi:hypothetical protein